MFTFLLFLIVQAIKDEDNECITLMKQITTNPTTDQLSLVMKYYGLSGNWIGKFGYYDRCLRENNGYSTVKIKMTVYQVFYGFCHWQNCTADDFNSEEGMKTIVNFIESTNISSLFQVNISETQLTFYNPQTYYPGFGWGSITTIIVICVIILITIFDPLNRFIYNYKTRKQRYEKQYQEKASRQSSISSKGSIISDKNQSIKKYIPTGFVKDFSIIINYKKLINLKTIDPNLALFSGIRSISFIMVAYGHVSEITALSTYIDEVNLSYRGWLVVNLYNMMYAVDIFFWVGGFFLGYVMCEQKKAQSMGKNPLSLFIAILHRLLRIWPCYILCIAINSYIIPFLGSGPRWFLNEGSTACTAGSWKNILFIDNFFEDWQICFGWGWYLTCDIQLFLTCLIPVFIYCLNYKIFSKFLIIIMIFGSLIWSYYISIHYDFLIPGKNTYNPDHYYKYYVSTYARASPYFLGLLIGILYREFKQQKSTGKIAYFQQFNDFAKKAGQRLVLQFLCYGFGIGIFIWLFFGWREEFLSVQLIWPKWFQHLYNACCRFLLTFGLTLISIPNLIGVYDIFNCKFMNNKLFKFIAKISFSMYLVHLMFIVLFIDTFYETQPFVNLSLITACICAIILSIIFGFFLCLLVEMPFGNLQVRLMKQLTRPNKKVNTLLD